MGEIGSPSAILHSTDINRSSQDTQQLRASQTEPVRHGAEGGSVGAQQGTILRNRLSQGAAGPNNNNKKTTDIERLLAFSQVY